jgi:hypothetical protein
MNFNIDELRHIIEALLRDTPDLADDPVLHINMLEGQTDMFSVLTALVDAAEETKMLARAMTARIEDLKARRTRFGRRLDGLREVMLKVMQSADLKRIELADATLSQRANPPQILGDIDVATLPDDICKIVREPDRTAIREALLAHREVPGVFLSNAPPGLMIKVK